MFGPEPNDCGDLDDVPPLFGIMTGNQDPGRDRGRGSKESVEQSFELETGRYRHDDGEFATGSPPEDYSPTADRFRANDGEFKNRSQDLGRGTKWDAPREDASNPSRGEVAESETANNHGVVGDLFDV